MERFVVTGGSRLAGQVLVPGAKNSVLKLMAASLLAPGTTTLSAVPDILDVGVMADVLTALGATVRRDLAAGSMAIDTPAMPGAAADPALVRRIRASVAILGPLVGRRGEARVALPGGDAIGSRALDMHVNGLRRLGAVVDIEDGALVARSSGRLQGAAIWLDFPSVGATENLLMAGAVAKGTTVIDNAAREPEIADLCEFLTEMGARIEGIGGSTLVIEGVDELHPVAHETVPDRIVAGTYAIGAVMTRGDVMIRNGRAEHLGIVLEKLTAAGASVETSADGFRVSIQDQPRSIDVVTLPYPGFPTDLLPQIIALEAVSQGISLITENVFDSRFVFCRELLRLGAQLRTDGHHVVVRPASRLVGAPVVASDVRAGAGLVLAGLVAEGMTEVHEVHHIDRGYAGFVENLRALGADILRDQVTAAA
ncbi:MULTISPECIES: UDP-N-acetylglucosamine 1-carboxyvinyltransferase [unclassified Pseudofrankia]|uniref:UDP-N-acetylglucosamine 1-carboxyvinyltransferase n=1 Tax=unclassified Pseudofrankia TaxID=2994372 RepID=UPI0008DA7A0B|nr:MULTISPECIES: UDP-N-acetylglucosamine 1-carboxyvinyltransferase [unclassified Pseudofrankia]MDT3445247.1 UDP-N-acetylglucosamine 1-carboxyvinyltransferase [Pseudofrankia sp. BMG5.37]OHV52564.1 UDP-N-acetylglucosamine 1-carboxyvinyltransferase [Pseudofrankia sp. BMG5.36]